MIEAKRSQTPIDSKILAALAARLVDAKKAVDINVFDVAEQFKLADYFVVASGQNRVHVRALENELHTRLKSMGERHGPVEGAALGWWIVLDYGDVVIHLLQPEAREFYDLDHLYGDCPRVDWRAVDVPEIPGMQPDSPAEV